MNERAGLSRVDLMMAAPAVVVVLTLVGCSLGALCQGSLGPALVALEANRAH